MSRRMKRALEEALLRQTMTGPGQQVFLQHTPEVMGNQITAAKGASIALPAGAADLAGLAAMAASQPYAYAGPGAAALSMQAQQAGLDMGGLEHPPFSGDPIRELVGLDPQDPWGIAGEMLDPSAAPLKGFALLLKAGMTALKTGVNMSGALAAMAPLAKIARIDPNKDPHGAVKQLKERLEKRFPGISAKLSTPTSAGGKSGYLEVTYMPEGRKPGSKHVGMNVRASDHGIGDRRWYQENLTLLVDESSVDETFKNFESHVEEVFGDVGVVPLEGKDIVSTRRPTAVAATENPVQEYLRVDLEAAQRDPKSFAKNVKAVTSYPNYRPKSGRTAPSARAEAFIEHVEDNLLWLHDQVPKPIRDRSAKWYDGTSVIVDRFGQNYPGLERRQYGGVIAVLSPQTDWYTNASQAERVLSIKSQLGAHRFDTAMRDVARTVPISRKMLNTIEGKRLDELSHPMEQGWWIRLFDQAHNPREYPLVAPEGDFMGIVTTAKGEPATLAWGNTGRIAKAVSIIENGSPANISAELGDYHKVRSFFNNMIDPNSPLGDVTIDTHAVAAGLLRPVSANSLEPLQAFGGVGSSTSSVHGIMGTYPLYAEAYRRAAEARGLLPRQMQSITWEAARGLFPDTLKRNKLIAGDPDSKTMGLIDKVWTQYRKKQISLNEARRAVHDIAEGIDPPPWHRLDTVLDAGQQGAGDTSQLFGAGLRNTGRGADPRTGTGTALELTEEELSRFDDRLKSTLR